MLNKLNTLKLGAARGLFKRCAAYLLAVTVTSAGRSTRSAMV